MTSRPRLTLDDDFIQDRHCAICGTDELRVVHLEQYPDYVACGNCDSAFVVEEEGERAMYGKIPPQFPETQRFALQQWAWLEAIEVRAAPERPKPPSEPEVDVPLEGVEPEPTGEGVTELEPGSIEPEDLSPEAVPEEEASPIPDLEDSSSQDLELDDWEPAPSEELPEWDEEPFAEVEPPDAEEGDLEFESLAPQEWDVEPEAEPEAETLGLEGLEEGEPSPEPYEPAAPGAEAAEGLEPETLEGLPDEERGEEPSTYPEDLIEEGEPVDSIWQEATFPLEDFEAGEEIPETEGIPLEEETEEGLEAEESLPWYSGLEEDTEGALTPAEELESPLPDEAEEDETEEHELPEPPWFTGLGGEQGEAEVDAGEAFDDIDWDAEPSAPEAVETPDWLFDSGDVEAESIPSLEAEALAFEDVESSGEETIEPTIEEIPPSALVDEPMRESLEEPPEGVSEMAEEDEVEAVEPVPGSRHRVVLQSTRPRFPVNVCAHCTRSPASKNLIVVSAVPGPAGGMERTSFTLPLCSSCHQRARARSEDERGARIMAHLIAALIALIVVVVALAAGLVAFEASPFLDAMILAILAVVGYALPVWLLLNRANRFPPPPDAAYVRSTLIVPREEGETVAFEWRNPLYADRFAETNRETLEGGPVEIDDRTAPRIQMPESGEEGIPPTS